METPFLLFTKLSGNIVSYVEQYPWNKGKKFISLNFCWCFKELTHVTFLKRCESCN